MRHIGEICTDRGDGNMDCDVKTKTPSLKLCSGRSLSYTTTGDCASGYTTKYKDQYGQWSTTKPYQSTSKEWNDFVKQQNEIKAKIASDKAQLEQQNKYPDMKSTEKQFIDQKPKPKLSFWDSFVCWFSRC